MRDLQRYRVTLDMTVDRDIRISPLEWDWSAVLYDLLESRGEGATVLSCEPLAPRVARGPWPEARSPKPEPTTCEVCGVRLKEADADGRCYMHSHAREGTEAAQ